MATINDKLEQKKAQTRELTEEELAQAAGGLSKGDPGLTIVTGRITKPKPTHQEKNITGKMI